MNYKIIQPKDFKTTEWSGGTTTELYIYPEGADFKSRAFEFRLSIATIHIEESDFTPLPDVDRTLLLLEGELELIHEGHHRTTLKPFKQDNFSGSWQTHCIGTGKDFNLMTKGRKGVICVVTENLLKEYSAKQVCLYALEGNTSVNGIELSEGSLIVLYESNQLQVNTSGKTIMIEVN